MQLVRAQFLITERTASKQPSNINVKRLFRVLSSRKFHTKRSNRAISAFPLNLKHVIKTQYSTVSNVEDL